MSQMKQMWELASGLFSSVLFCLWLSTASLVVWVDFGLQPAVPAASTDAIKHH